MRFFPSLLLFLLITACAEEMPEETQSPEASARIARETPVEVRVQPVQRGSFPLRTISSGVLEAARQVELRAPATGRIVVLDLEEGKAVDKGQLLLQVDDTEQQFRLRQSRLQLEEATVNKQDMIVSNGGTATVDTSVSPQKLEFILISSGYKRAEQAIEEAEAALAKTSFHAPFGGLIADLEVRLHQQIIAGTAIARLIDPASFEVVFPLLEAEAVQVRPGQQVSVRPIALPGRELAAEITGLNPVVNEQGLVAVRARLRAGGGRSSLFEGMKVEVVIERPVSDQLIVPKSAVVLRSGREVVFSYDPENQLAKWNYVQIARENDDAVAISEGLEAGMLVICEGNLNLAHDAAVQVME
jgi:RND family efflux transporter MFP subunit